MDVLFFCANPPAEPWHLPKNKIAARRSGCDFERRSKGTTRGVFLIERLKMRRSKVDFASTLERVKGIEPSYSAWEADVLPLNYTRIARTV